MAVSRRLRFEVLRRDSYTCRYCGATAPDVTLTVDHVNPTALGGEDRPENLVTACSACNGGKSSIPPDAGVVADVAADALRWSEAMLRAADEMIENIDLRNEARAEFDETWSSWGTGPEGVRQQVPRPVDWELSIDQFVAAGLPMAILLDCVDKAMQNSKVRPEATFRYMCGIAWKKVQQLQETARESLVDEETPIAGVNNEILADYRAAAKALIDLPPDETIDGFAIKAIDELNWPEHLRTLDGGRLYREAIGARMLLIFARQFLAGSEEDSE